MRLNIFSITQASANYLLEIVRLRFYLGSTILTRIMVLLRFYKTPQLVGLMVNSCSPTQTIAMNPLDGVGFRLYFGTIRKTWINVLLRFYKTSQH